MRGTLANIIVSLGVVTNPAYADTIEGGSYITLPYTITERLKIIREYVNRHTDMIIAGETQTIYPKPVLCDILSINNGTELSVKMICNNGKKYSQGFTHTYTNPWIFTSRGATMNFTAPWKPFMTLNTGCSTLLYKQENEDNDYEEKDCLDA